eukprot:1928112-Prymnesium_polylepis.2
MASARRVLALAAMRRHGTAAAPRGPVSVAGLVRKAEGLARLQRAREDEAAVWRKSADVVTAGLGPGFGMSVSTASTETPAPDAEWRKQWVQRLAQVNAVLQRQQEQATEREAGWVREREALQAQLHSAQTNLEAMRGERATEQRQLRDDIALLHGGAGRRSTTPAHPATPAAKSAVPRPATQDDDSEDDDAPAAQRRALLRARATARDDTRSSPLERGRAWADRLRREPAEPLWIPLHPQGTQ